MDTVHKTTSRSDEDTEIDRSTHTKNYYLLVLFHADLDQRPCRPVLQVVHLSQKPETMSCDIHANPQGVDILTTCQLCDPSTNSRCAFHVDLNKLLCVCAVNITDTEASIIVNHVSKINVHTAQNNVTLTERSNIAFAPTWIHKYLKVGKHTIGNIDNMSNATDVQVAILLIQESIDKSRSIWSQTNALHPSMSTPENLYDAISDFTRNLDTESFKRGAFKFITI